MNIRRLVRPKTVALVRVCASTTLLMFGHQTVSFAQLPQGLYERRSECAHFGELILEEERRSPSKGQVEYSETNHYSEASERCFVYVTMTLHPEGKPELVVRTLYDGQTRRNIAQVVTQGDSFRDGSCPPSMAEPDSYVICSKYIAAAMYGP
jgi:hypothetical protein